MVSETPNWIWVALALTGVFSLVVGLVLGITYSPSTRRARELEAEVQSLKTSHDQYRNEVTSHFAKTGELVNAMTRTYKSVYDHLASGAQTLSDAKLVTTRLQFYNEQVPVLKTGLAEGDVPVPSTDSAAGEAQEAKANEAEQPESERDEHETSVESAPKDYAPTAQSSSAKESGPTTSHH